VLSGTDEKFPGMAGDGIHRVKSVHDEVQN